MMATIDHTRDPAAANLAPEVARVDTLVDENGNKIGIMGG